VTITPEQVQLARRLRASGAGMDEVTTVLLLAAEVDYILDFASAAAHAKAHATAHASAARAAAARARERDEHGRFSPHPALAHVPGPSAAEQKHRDIQNKAILAGAKADSAQRQIAELKKQAAEQHQEILHLMTAVRRANQKIAELGKQEQTKSLRRRLASHAGILLGSAALTAATAGAGTPALITAGVAVGPSLISELIDFFKGL
jgi:hypothetical protein